MFSKKGNRLVINHLGLETWIEPWGKDSVRVRVFPEGETPKNDWALDTIPDSTESSIEIRDVKISEPWHVHYENPESHVKDFQEASLVNGRIKVQVNFEGWISFGM